MDGKVISNFTYIYFPNVYIVFAVLHKLRVYHAKRIKRFELD